LSAPFKSVRTEIDLFERIEIVDCVNRPIDRTSRDPKL